MNFISNQTGGRLAAAVLGYIVLLILLLTWNPFYLAHPEDPHLSLRIGPRDAIRNILLFLPVGFLYRLMQGGLRGAIRLAIRLCKIAPNNVPNVLVARSTTEGVRAGIKNCPISAAALIEKPKRIAPRKPPCISR